MFSKQSTIQASLVLCAILSFPSLISSSPVVTGSYSTPAQNYNVIWEFDPNSSNVTFTLSAAVTGWVALGLNTAPTNHGADIYIGYVDDFTGQAYIFDKYDIDCEGPILDPINNIELIGGSQVVDVNGIPKTTIVFTRYIVTGDYLHDLIVTDATYLIGAYHNTNDDVTYLHDVFLSVAMSFQNPYPYPQTTNSSPTIIQGVTPTSVVSLSPSQGVTATPVVTLTQSLTSPVSTSSNVNNNKNQALQLQTGGQINGKSYISVDGDFSVAWSQPTNGLVSFTLISKGTGWLAIGFNTQKDSMIGSYAIMGYIGSTSSQGQLRTGYLNDYQHGIQIDYQHLNGGCNLNLFSSGLSSTTVVFTTDAAVLSDALYLVWAYHTTSNVVTAMHTSHGSVQLNSAPSAVSNPQLLMTILVVLVPILCVVIVTSILIYKFRDVLLNKKSKTKYINIIPVSISDEEDGHNNESEQLT